MRFRIVIHKKSDWPKELFRLFLKIFFVSWLVFSVVTGVRGCAMRRLDQNGRTINEEGPTRTSAYSIPI